MKQRIKESQLKAAISANRELILLYWDIGKEILERQNKEGWGAKIIDRLSTDLKQEFPGMKGFSPRNLKYMRAFAENYPDREFVQEVLAQITWYHNIAVFEKIKEPAERRERKSDIPLFIDYFIHHFNIIQEKKITGVSPEVMEILLNHHYPGNLRELRNIMEYDFIFCNEGEIQSKHLPDYLPAAVHVEEFEKGADSSPKPFTGEKEMILGALNEARWNKAKAAESLQVDRTTLWRKMKKYGIR